MHKALSSFLIALSIYLLVIAAVLYAYTQYQSKLSEGAIDTAQVVTFDVISTAESKPTPKKQPEPKVEKREGKIPKKPSLPKSIKTEQAKKTPAKPIQKPLQAPKAKKIEPPVEKIVPRTIAAPLSIQKDPTKTLALKHIPPPLSAQVTKPIRKPTSSPTKQRIKKKRERAKKYQNRTERRVQSKRSSRGSSTHKKRSGSIGKNRFLARLKSKINRNKHYPRIAEKRGLTGAVRVRFTILRSGRVGDISLSGATPFYRSTKSAIERAFPINPDKAPFPLPYRTGFVMRYK
jgi:protein TonB